VIVDLLLSRLPWLVILWLSLTVHEWAHARAAFALGDNTAASQGRMTLDPLAHVDPLGTLLLPLLGVPFGWASPVPVEPTRFDRRYSMSLGMLLCAAAGPLSNVVLAGLGLVGLVVVAALFPWTVKLLLLPWGMALVNVNVALAVSIMLPVPPLDGSRVVNHFLPRSLQGAWGAVEQAGRFVPIAVLLGLSVLGLDPVTWAYGWMDRLMQGLVAVAQG
jgi:Zn-dependent protease